MAEYTTKQSKISYFPVGKYADVYLRKNEREYKNEEGQTFYEYDELSFKTTAKLSEIEENFDKYWQKEPTAEERLAVLEKAMLGVILGG
jgi:hypothetical protein